MKKIYILALGFLLSSCENSINNLPTSETTQDSIVSNENSNNEVFSNGNYEFLIDLDENTFVIDNQQEEIISGTYKKLSNSLYYCTSGNINFYVEATNSQLSIPYLMEYNSDINFSSYDLDYNFFINNIINPTYYSYINLYNNGVYKIIYQVSPIDKKIVKEIYGSYKLSDNFVFCENNTYLLNEEIAWDITSDEGVYYDAFLLTQSRKTYKYFESPIDVIVTRDSDVIKKKWENINGYVAYFIKANAMVYKDVNDTSFKKDHLRIFLSNGSILIYDFNQYKIIDGRIILENCNLVLDASFMN